MEGNENTAVLDIWDKAFPDAEPLAWILREKKQKNWFRLYSLPNGKRYATNSKERAEVLRRSNFVFDTLFRDNKNEILTLIPVEKLSVEYEKFNRTDSNYRHPGIGLQCRVCQQRGATEVVANASQSRFGGGHCPIVATA